MSLQTPLRTFRRFYKACKEWISLAVSFPSYQVKWLANYAEILQGGKSSTKAGIPLNALGKPRPWITYPCIEFLEQLDFSNSSVFEYGSGGSSRWWAEKCQKIISIENNEKWYEATSKALLPNQGLLLRKLPTSYISSIQEAAAIRGLFDVIVIDGSYRFDCAALAHTYRKHDGIILLDNADWFPETCQLLRNNGLTQIDFIGLGPLNSYSWCTSLFVPMGFAFPRKSNSGQITVQGGLSQKSPEDTSIYVKNNPSVVDLSVPAGTKKRPVFPRKKSFGLFGLDLKLANYMSFRNGVFIEAGANDGVSQSNTLYFERYLGWTGLLIEPIPELAERCRANRSNCIVENAALVDFDFKGDEIQMHFCNLMSIVDGARGSHEADREHIQAGLKVQGGVNAYDVHVPARTLSSILDKHGYNHIDLFSLDVEGFELSVLKGLDFGKHRPTYMLIETSERDSIDEYLRGNYRCIAQLSHHDYLYQAL